MPLRQPAHTGRTLPVCRAPGCAMPCRQGRVRAGAGCQGNRLNEGRRTGCFSVAVTRSGFGGRDAAGTVADILFAHRLGARATQGSSEPHGRRKLRKKIAADGPAAAIIAPVSECLAKLASCSSDSPGSCGIRVKILFRASVSSSLTGRAAGTTWAYRIILIADPRGTPG